MAICRLVLIPIFQCRFQVINYNFENLVISRLGSGLGFVKLLVPTRTWLVHSHIPSICPTFNSRETGEIDALHFHISLQLLLCPGATQVW